MTRALGSEEDLLRLMLSASTARSALPFVSAHHEPDAAPGRLPAHTIRARALARLLARRPGVQAGAPPRGRDRLRVASPTAACSDVFEDGPARPRDYAQPAPQEHGILLHGTPGTHDALRWASPADLATRVSAVTQTG